MMAGPYWREPCIPGCVRDHADDVAVGFKCCWAVAGTVWLNTLVPHPRPVPLEVGALRAIGPPEDADLDESTRMALWRDAGEPDVLTPETARQLGWTLLAAADALDRRC